jgi:hypothetical protein
MEKIDGVPLGEYMGEASVRMGLDVRRRINSISRYDRGSLTTSVLKNYEGSNSKKADTEGETVFFEHMKKLSNKIGRNIRVVVDPFNEKLYEIGSKNYSEQVYAYADPVDGTIKLSGLGSDSENHKYRVGNNGAWASGVAFTMPVKKDLSELTIEDFEISAIVDGNPTRYRAYPKNAVAFKDGGVLKTWEISENSPKNCVNYYRLGTSSQINLSQGTVLFDAFQAYDRNSAASGTEEKAVDVFRKLINRNEGGAFDIVRMYGTMGEVLRQLVEKSSSSYEPQGVGSISFNENLPNVVPIRPVIEGAGGYVVDFDGKPVRDLNLKSVRPNVVIAANEAIRDKLLKIVK